MISRGSMTVATVPARANENPAGGLREPVTGFLDPSGTAE
jgi:hypothetical protein